MHSIISKRYRSTVFLLIALLTLSAASMAQAQPDQRCFAETNQCIAGPIRAYWERNGGLPIFGYPVSPQQIETVEGQTLPVQWFERDRLEDHGAAGVMAGRLGARYLEITTRPWEYFDKLDRAATPAGCQFAEPTGHSLCEPYLSYWRQHGGLERFGYPVTEPFRELIEGKLFEVQYFERRRMELHSELAGGPILLGLLGNQVRETPVPQVGYPECLAEQSPAKLQQIVAQIHIDPPIGCPGGAAWTDLQAAIQHFEHGTMIWLDARRHPLPMGYPPTILTLVEPGPMAANYSDTWQAGQDPDTPAATPPQAGLYAPWRGFGKLWMENTQLREAIGWATEPQAQARTANTQLFSSGLLVHFNETGEVYIFGNPNAPAPIHLAAP